MAITASLYIPYIKTWTSGFFQFCIDFEGFDNFVHIFDLDLMAQGH